MQFENLKNQLREGILILFHALKIATKVAQKQGFKRSVQFALNDTRFRPSVPELATSIHVASDIKLPCRK